MKISILSIFLLLSSYCFAQVVPTFFEKTISKNGKSFAPALLPLLVDSSDQHIKNVEYNTIIKTVKTVDTLHFDGFYRLGKAANYQHIAELGDTITKVVLLKNETTRLTIAKGRYEKVTETYIYLPERNSPRYLGKTEADLLNANNWIIDSLPIEYKKFTRRIMVSPGHSREERIPAEYITILAFVPNHSLTKSEETLLLKYARSSEIFEQQETNYLPQENITFYEKEEGTVLQNGQIELVEVYKLNEIKPKVASLKKKLGEDNLYTGAINRQLDDAFKIALMKYQLSGKFPIGQFDKGSIDALLYKE